MEKTLDTENNKQAMPRIMSEHERDLRINLLNRRQFYVAQLQDIQVALNNLEDETVQKVLVTLSVANRPCGIPGGQPAQTAPDGGEVLGKEPKGRTN
jgi:hypothetical protein